MQSVRLRDKINVIPAILLRCFAGFARSPAEAVAKAYRGNDIEGEG
jgi:hypothetical protein